MQRDARRCAIFLVGRLPYNGPCHHDYISSWQLTILLALDLGEAVNDQIQLSIENSTKNKEIGSSSEPMEWEREDEGDIDGIFK